jgi:hypothetical protein
MSLAAIEEIAAIHRIIDPWLRVRSYSQARDSGGLYPEGPYSFEAEVKADPDAPLDAEWGTAQAARNVRSHLMSRASDALDALEAAGWHLGGNGMQIEISGGACWIPGRPSLHGNVGAVMRFTVDRHRTDEERAMDPEVIADKLLGPLSG